MFDRLAKLREFSSGHFKKHRIPMMGKNSNTSSDFDMIMQVTDCTQHGNFFKVFLTDGTNKYELNHRENVERGIYKVRSIASVEWEEDKGVLIGNDYTNFIHVPDWMKSAKSTEWEKLNKPTVAKKKNEEITTRLHGDGHPRLLSLRELSLKGKYTHNSRIAIGFGAYPLPVPGHSEWLVRAMPEEIRLEEHHLKIVLI